MSGAYNSIADLYVDRYKDNKSDLIQQNKPRSRKTFARIVISIILLCMVYSLKYSENKTYLQIYEVIKEQVIVKHIDTELIYNDTKSIISQVIEQIKSRVRNAEKL